MIESQNHLDQENAALLAAILRTAVDAIITIDDRGVIQQVNHAVERLFGYSRDEVIGQNISILMPEPDRSQHDQYLSRYAATNKAAIIGIGREVLGRCKDGSLIPIDLAVSEVEVGGRVLFTGILRDMTQRNETEASLRLAEQKIIQSERLAAIGQMMTGLAHESRNALQRSRACLDILELELQALPEQLDLVQRSRGAILELQTLYEEVKSYASPIVLERSRSCLRSICEEVWANLTEDLRLTGLELEIAFDGCSQCNVDRYRIGQVFRNIIENAIFFSPANGTIQVNGQAAEIHGKPFVRVSVRDEGPGLDDVQRCRLFEPFYTTKTKGTGLGLAICQRIVEAHGGTISAGNPDHGTEIVFNLPME